MRRVRETCPAFFSALNSLRLVPRRCTMFTYHHSRFATGLLVATALLGAACHDATSSGPASSLSATPSFSRAGNGGADGSACFSVPAHAAVSSTGGSVSGEVGTL